MSDTDFEGFVRGSRTDPNAAGLTNADGTARQVTLNLGDRAQTILISDTTQQIVLLNKLVEWRSHWKQETDSGGSLVGIDRTGGDGPDISGGATTSFTDAASGYGIHIAAATGDASDNAKGQGPNRDSNGFERGHESNKIDLRDADGAISDELMALFRIALDGGDAGSAMDNNLRVGNVSLGDPDTGDGFVVEIIVDGKWSSDVLKLTGTLARDLLAAMPDAAPGFDVGDGVALSLSMNDFGGGSNSSETIAIGDSSALPSGSTDDQATVRGTQVAFNDVFDLFGEIDRSQDNFVGDALRPEETTLLIQAGVFMALTGRTLIDGLAMVFDGDPDTTDTVTLALTNIAGVTDSLSLQGTGVSAAIATALGRFTSADFGSVRVDDFYNDNPVLFAQLIQNIAPIAQDSTVTGDEDTHINGVARASDVDAPDTDLAFAVATGPTHGTIAMQSDGTFTYTPDRDFFGTDSLVFRAIDSDRLSAMGTITVTVNAVGDAPTATPIDAGSVTEDDQTVTIDLLSTATDRDTPRHDLTIVESSVSVTDEEGPVAFTLAPDGKISIDPGQYNTLRADTERQVTISDAISDGTLTTQNIATLSVLGVNDAPIPIEDRFTVDADWLKVSTLSGLASNDIDPDGDQLRLVTIGQANTVGEVSSNLLLPPFFDSLDNWVYNPNGAFDALADGESATDSFTYTIRDPFGATSSATTTITIKSVNDVPIAADDDFSTTENAPIFFILSGLRSNDIDPEKHQIRVIDVDDSNTKGDVGLNTFVPPFAISPDNWFYNPNGQFDDLKIGETAVDNFTYTIVDSFGVKSTATVNIAIAGVSAPSPASIFTSSDGSLDRFAYYTRFTDNDAFGRIGTNRTAAIKKEDAQFRYLDAGDVNGDGLLDVFLGGVEESVIYYGAGSSLFPPFLGRLETGEAPFFRPMLVDLDGDGDLDIAAVDSPNKFALNLGTDKETGRAVFSDPKDLPGTDGGFYADADTADFDGDGLIDLVIPVVDGTTRILYAQGDTNGDAVIGPSETLSLCRANLCRQRRSGLRCWPCVRRNTNRYLYQRHPIPHAWSR